jgi:hypothetical protein
MAVVDEWKARYIELKTTVEQTWEDFALYKQHLQAKVAIEAKLRKECTRLTDELAAATLRAATLSQSGDGSSSTSGAAPSTGGVSISAGDFAVQQQRWKKSLLEMKVSVCWGCYAVRSTARSPSLFQAQFQCMWDQYVAHKEQVK